MLMFQNAPLLAKSACQTFEGNFASFGCRMLLMTASECLCSLTTALETAAGFANVVVFLLAAKSTTLGSLSASTTL